MIAASPADVDVRGPVLVAVVLVGGGWIDNSHDNTRRVPATAAHAVLFSGGLFGVTRNPTTSPAKGLRCFVHAFSPNLIAVMALCPLFAYPRKGILKCRR
jgi:hypothetical protein